MSLQDVLTKKGPRRLLALDAGGIRCFITLEVLSKLEKVLAQVRGSGKTFVLADYFDYIGGSETGAIIAAGLARGCPVAELTEFFTHANNMFDLHHWERQFTYRSEDARLRESLRALAGADTTFGDDGLRTLLMLVLRSGLTHGPLSLSNNPRGRYGDPARPDNNLRLPLWALMRASCPAPLYFPPEVIELGRHAMVVADGGSTIHSNPAFQLFRMATAKPYRLEWKTGTDRMLLVSVGSGIGSTAAGYFGEDSVGAVHAVPTALLNSASRDQDLACRVVGHVVEGPILDREVGDMIETGAEIPRKLFTYVRYDADLSSPGLAGLGLPEIDPADLQTRHGDPHQIESARAVGRAVARRVTAEQFEGFD